MKPLTKLEIASAIAYGAAQKLLQLGTATRRTVLFQVRYAKRGHLGDIPSISIHIILEVGEYDLVWPSTRGRMGILAGYPIVAHPPNCG